MASRRSGIGGGSLASRGRPYYLLFAVLPLDHDQRMRGLAPAARIDRERSVEGRTAKPTGSRAESRLVEGARFLDAANGDEAGGVALRGRIIDRPLPGPRVGSAEVLARRSTVDRVPHSRLPLARREESLRGSPQRSRELGHRRSDQPRRLDRRVRFAKL